MISLKNLERTYSSKKRIHYALRDINLEIDEGEVFGIIGKPNSGKTTLIKCINMLEPPTGGSVIINEQNLTLMSPNELRMARSKVAILFQNANLMSSRTVLQNITLPLELQGLSKVEISETVTPLLEMVGLADKRNAYPYQINQGLKQRVALARALVSKPSVLMCDEVTTNLDAKTTQAFLRLLKKINEKLHLTMLIITHEIDVIKTICHRVGVLNQGQLVEEGSVADVYTNPESETAKEFIRATSRMDMPSSVRRRIQSAPLEYGRPVLRFSFRGETAQEPLIAYVIQNFDITVNIIQAHSEIIHNEQIGIMIVELVGQNSLVQEAINFLEEKGLHVEVLGYVAGTI